MKQSPKTSLRILVVLMAACHIFTFCTKKFQPQLSTHNAEIKDGVNSPELYKIPDPDGTDRNDSIERNSRKKLQEFRSSGDERDPSKENSLAGKIIATAMEYLGVPHCMGGTTTRCIDCSGLVMVVFEEYGINLPHNAQEQSKSGKMIKDKKDLQKGDLVFFTGSYRTSRYITHSGIYAGDNKFIHASSGNGVTITSLDDSWWKGKYAFGTRIIR